jgi:hypothetical protein
LEVNPYDNVIGSTIGLDPTIEVDFKHLSPSLGIGVKENLDLIHAQVLFYVQ